MNSKKHDFRPAGLYIHIPFCQTKCRYCGFYSEPIKNHAPQRLISAIITELTEKRGQPALSEVEGEPFFQTIYIGGGSPSCLPAKQLLRLIGQITSRWPKPEEFTIEVNPGQVNKDILSQLRAAGVTRISIGAQSFASEELTFLGRKHSVADIGRAVRSAKGAGFDNIGLDLIFAIPRSTLKSWKHSLRSAIDLGVRHISAYALTYEEQTPLQKAVETGEVTPVDEETDRQMYEMTIDELEKAGFKQYEISNFAKPGFECKHNLNYWANKPYLGIGPAAGSYWNGKRTLNIADIKKYTEAIEQGKNATAESETPDNIQVACETAVLNFRRRCGIILDEFKKQTGFDAAKLFAEPIGKYKKLGLIRTTSKRLCLTRKALPIADSVLCDFSAT
ncbi:MAG: radical SAM family heme chaperone HemW [Sedimentisphaerales bacterium]|jgi:oxygen-independent coproporphyrinogen-3 oxidase